MQLELEKVRYWNGDRVIVEVCDMEEKTRGLYVPLNYADVNGEDKKCWKGKVLGFGAQIDFEEPGWGEVKKGRYVWLRPMALHCASFVVNGKKVVACAQEDVFLVEIPGEN